MMTRGGDFALYPPARHHLRCPGSIASRCFDNIASRSSNHRYAMLRSLRDLRSRMLEDSKSSLHFDCFCAVKEKTPGFPGFYPPGVFGSPGDLGSSRYRLTAQHGTAGSTKEIFPIFHHQNFNRQFSHQNGIVVRVVSALWGGVWVKCDYDASAVLLVLQSRTSHQNAIYCNNRKKTD